MNRRSIGRFSGVKSILLSALMGLACLSAHGEAFIVKDGKAQAEIVISDKPARLTKFAARELQLHIEKITGATLMIGSEPSNQVPVKIYVGKSAHTDKLNLSTEGLAHGAFRMASGKDWMALLGPDEDFVPIEPWRRTRGESQKVLDEWDKITGDTFADPHGQLFRRYNKNFDAWDYDDRGTVNAVHEFLRGLGVRWYFPGELGEIIPKMASVALPDVNRVVTPDFALRHFAFYYEPDDTDFLWRMRLGINLGPEILGLTQCCHGTKFVTTREEYKKNHPEMYAVWAGKRAIDHRECGAPCLSSSLFHEKCLKFARVMFDHYKEPMLSIDVSDGYGAQICQCGQCKGTPERGWRGSMSDYVWGHINRLAQELYKTHPNHKVSGLAYSAYLLPPEKTGPLSPNVSLMIAQTRSTFNNRETRDQYVALRSEWLKILPSKDLYLFEYYLHNRPNRSGQGIPAYFQDLIAEDMRSLKGVTRGELIEIYNHPDPAKFPWHAQAVNHVNIYVTSQLLWNATQDLDAMMEEYYTLFYGPARNEMKTFIEYCTKNWPAMTKQPETIDQALALLATARQAAGDTVYGKRVDLVVDYTKPLTQLRDQLNKVRENVPSTRCLPRKKADFTLDGKLDDKFWEGTRTAPLLDIKTGKAPKNKGSFKIAWGSDDALYIGVRCMEPDTAGITNGTTHNDNPGIWMGDNIEVFIETQVHSYYQIAINPAGAIMDTDRSVAVTDNRWSSGTQVATHIGDGFWSAEIRIPCAGETAREIDVLNGVAGRPPSNTYPWHINVARQRMRGKNDVEVSAWSPPGDKKLSDPMKYGKVYIK